MAKRVLGKLSARAVATVGPGRHSDGGGLYLVASDDGRRRWQLRYTLAGRIREIGLGSVREVSLAEARIDADACRRLVRDGLDPLVERHKAVVQIPTFGKAAEDFIASIAGTFRNEKHRAQWPSTIATYCKAIISKRVDQVDTADVLAVLKPIWTAKPETAARVRGRVERILDAAKVQGFRSGENPARWRGHLDKLLTKRGKLTRGHHKAMPFEDVPAFMAKVRATESIGARALELTILTACRSGEVLGARWSEIDLEKAVWVIPRERMKAADEHRVPLSLPALELLNSLSKTRTGDFVFPANRQRSKKAGAGHLSSMAMAMTLRRMNAGVTVHGFRSSFRDWAGERTDFAREVAEAALAHRVGDATERAYRRGDALEKRRALMEMWAQWCAKPASGNVLPMLRPA